VGRDVAIGTQMYVANNNFGNQSMFFDCDTPTEPMRLTVINAPHPRLNISIPGVADGALFETSVEGIGAWVGQANVPFTPEGTERDLSSAFSVVRWYDVILVKYAARVGSGVITGADLPVVRATYGSNNLVVLEGGFTGSLTVAGRTCRTPDVIVDMGDHLLRELSGVGTGTASVDVPIVLSECPAFHARYRQDRTRDSGIGSTVLPNTIEYGISPTFGAYDAPNGVMNLDAAPGSASGIGLQMLDANDVAVPLSRFRNSQLPLEAVDNASYTIPLKARYVQTSDSVAAGAANTTATVTLRYQ
jgi:type 1 fimbria pilin